MVDHSTPTWRTKSAFLPLELGFAAFLTIITTSTFIPRFSIGAAFHGDLPLGTLNGGVVHHDCDSMRVQPLLVHMRLHHLLLCLPLRVARMFRFHDGSGLLPCDADLDVEYFL